MATFLLTVSAYALASAANTDSSHFRTTSLLACTRLRLASVTEPLARLSLLSSVARSQSGSSANGYIPGVVTGQVFPQRPYPFGKGATGKRVRLSCSGSPWALVATDREICLDHSNPQRTLRASADTCRFQVNQSRDEDQCVAHRGHIRPASRASSICDGSWVFSNFFRSRTLCRHMSTEGLDAMCSRSH